MKPSAAGLPLAVFGIASAIVYLAGDTGGPMRSALKPLPVLALAGWVASRSRGPLGRLVVSGLAVSAVGDLLLDAGRFLPGLLSFLAAHLSYTAAFLWVERRPALLRALPFAAWGVSTFGWLRPALGAMAAPVGIYCAVISVMMWRAAARVGGERAHPPAARLGLAGALAFGASDTLIAVDRFLAPIPGVRLPIMLLYWLGQWGIAASASIGSAGPAAGRRQPA